MTTGRINQVARPPRRAGTATTHTGPRGSTEATAGPAVVFFERLCEERGTEGPRSYNVSSIRDQQRR